MAILQNTAFATVKNLTKPNIKRELLEKTLVLNHALLARLKSQFLPSATATVATDSGITLTHVKTEGVIPPSPPKNRERDYLVTEPKIQLSDVRKIDNFLPITDSKKIMLFSFRYSTRN